MMPAEHLAAHIPAGQLQAAVEAMGAAEVYAVTNTYPEGFPVPTHQLDAAAELVRRGLLAEPSPGRFKLAASREIVL